MARVFDAAGMFKGGGFWSEQAASSDFHRVPLYLPYDG